MFANRKEQACEVCHGIVLIGEGYAMKRPNQTWMVKHKACSGIAADARPVVTVAWEDSKRTALVFAPKDYLGDKFNAFRRAMATATYRNGKNYAGVSATPGILTALDNEGFMVEIPADIRAAVTGHVTAISASLVAATDRAMGANDALKARGMSLFNYQIAGIRWLGSRMGALLCDDMGLGKTAQTIIALPDNAPVVVVAPAVAKSVWRREVKKWRPDLKVTVLSGERSFRWPALGEVVVLNYDIQPETDAEVETIEAHVEAIKAKVREMTPLGAPVETMACGDVGGACAGLRAPRLVLGALDAGEAVCWPRQAFCGGPGMDTAGRSVGPCLAWTVLPAVPARVPAAPAGVVVVADEVHNAKSRDARRSKRLRALADAARAAAGRVWGLTATPLLNGGPELWNLLELCGIAEESFGSFWAYARAMGGYKGRFGMEWTTSVDTETVTRCFQKVSLRRTKAQALPDLPTKRHEHITIDIDDSARALADVGLDDVGGIEKLLEMLRAGNTTAFRKMARARAALARAKIPAMIELVEEHEAAGEPLVVFSAHRSPIDHLAKREGWATITGDTSGDERGRIEEAFQRGELKGVAGTIDACGVAITLTRAARVLFVDQDWTPSLNQQAEDRCLRIGQTRGVLITILVADHPLDARVAELLTEKSTVIGASVEASARLIPEINIPAAPDFAAIDARAAEEAAKVAEAQALAAQMAANAPPPPPKPVRPVPDHASKSGKKRTPQSLVDVADAKPRAAATSQEVWAASALATLAGLDPDGAREKNGVGFNGTHTRTGHWLAAMAMGEGLTDFQWRKAIKIARTYPDQVGRCPEPEVSEPKEEPAAA